MVGNIKKMFIVLLSNIVNGSNHTKNMLSNQKCILLDLLILIYILMNTVKNFTPIHLRLN